MSLRRKIALWLCPELGEEIILLTLGPKALSWVGCGVKLQTVMNAVAAKQSAENAVEGTSLVSEIITLHQEVAAMRRDIKAQAEYVSPFLQSVNKTIRRWDADGLPPSRQ